MSLGDYPRVGSEAPQRTLYGTLLPPMGKVVAYVRHAFLDGIDEDIATNLKPTLAAALTSCVAGRNDIIVVLPGHAENVGAAYLASLKEGTQIVGVGTGTNKPVFTFNATGSQWAIAAANVGIFGVQLNFGGGADVTLGVDVTAANVRIAGCEVITAASSTSRATTVMRLSAGANRFTLEDCVWRGTNGANSCVDGIIVNAAVAQLKVLRNHFTFGTTVTTVGQIRFATAAATECLIAGNWMHNTTASSTACIDFDVAATGIFADNRMFIMSNQAAGAGGFVGTSGGGHYENYVTGVANTSGYLAPAADT